MGMENDSSLVFPQQADSEAAGGFTKPGGASKGRATHTALLETLDTHHRDPLCGQCRGWALQGKEQV